MLQLTIPPTPLNPQLLDYKKKLVQLCSERNWKDDEASLLLVDDMDSIAKYQETAKLLQENLKVVIVIGIGGSNLGTKAIYDALKIREGGMPLLFLDTCDTWSMDQVLAEVRDLGVTSFKQLVVVLISKSGRTTETIANFSVFISESIKFLGEVIPTQVVVIADSESPLDSFAREQHFNFLSIPATVGGRYSVFSAVGLFPLFLCGIDVLDLIQGAKDQRDLDLGRDGDASHYASFLFSQLRLGKDIHDLFLFAPRMETAGKWFRQLFAESLGKQGNGLLPTVSIGSNDLHSILQMYLGGKSNVVTTFVSTEGKGQYHATELGKELVKGIEGRNIEEIKKAIFIATLHTYSDHHVPFAHIHLDAVDAYNLGAFMLFYMVTVMMLASCMRVNAFDQPDVEDYKKELLKLLSE